MYIPKNRIKTNLYTSGGEYIKRISKEEYVGYYHTLYTGKAYTGKNLNDKPIEELVKQSREMDSVWTNTSEDKEFQQYAENYDGEVVPGQIQKMEDVNNYNFITKTDISISSQLPQQYYPSPTEDDYALGTFTRYFAVKINELIYLEIDFDTYNLLSSKNNSITWRMYIPFKTQWTIDGVEGEVFDINRNQTLILEKRLNRRGLQEFFDNNYLEYYRSENLNNQYTSGDDYTLPNGLNYQGLYHIMSNGVAMTGRFHGEGDDILLVPISRK